MKSYPSSSSAPQSASDQNQEERSSFLGRVFFWWIVPYLRVFGKKDLDLEDLLEPRDGDKPEAVLSEIDLSRRPLLSALMHANRMALIRAAMFALVLAGCSAIIPLTFRFFLGHLVGDSPLVGLVPAILALGAAFITQSLSVHHMFFQVLRATQRVRVALAPIIYKKLGKLSFEALQEFPSGRIVNLVATDANRIAWFFNLSFSFLLHPLQVLVTVSVLCYLLGVAGLFGSASLLVSLVLVVIFSRRQARLKKQALSIADSRVALTTEALNAIKLIKLYGWESPRALEINALREREAALLKKAALLDGLNAFLFGAAPVFFSLIAITVMSYSGRAIRLVDLLPALSALATLRFALSAIPSGIQALLDARVSAERISHFLQASESESTLASLSCSQSSGSRVAAESLTSNWPGGKIAVRSASLTLKPGEIIAITGAVGAGKTALLLTLGGELSRTRGSLTVANRREYVPQIPWILSDSVRENITMGLAYDDAWYKQVLHATALDEDVAQFPHGDLTIIGERGVNLSGGQRHRVALARAAYTKPDLLLLDDPLSALDPTIATRIFNDLFRGSLHNAAIVLVTHRLEFARRCDHAYVIADGVLSKPDVEIHQDNASFDANAAIGAAHADSPDSTTRSIVDEEERNVGAVKGATVNRYLHRFTRGGWGIGLFLIFLLREVFTISLDLWIAILGRGFETAVKFAIPGILTLGIGVVVFAFLRLALTMIRGLNISTRYHSELVSGVLSAPLQFFTANPVGRIVNRFSRDITALDDSVPKMLHDFVGCFLSVSLVATILVVSSHWMALVLVPVFALYFWAQSIYRPASRECQRLDATSKSPIFSLLAETTAGVTTLRHSAGLAVLEGRMMAASGSNGKAFYNLVGCNRWLGLMIESLSVVVIVSAFTLAVRASATKELAFVALGLTLVLSMSGTLNWLIRSLSLLEAGLTSAERLEVYTALEPEERASEQPEIKRLSNWPQSGRISFRDAAFAYRSDLPPSLLGVTLEINSGDKIGIIGRTGAGKSTLLMGLFRAIELRRGTIEIDGVDLTEIPRAVLRRKLGYIPQEPTILSGTLRQNIDPFNEFSDEQVWHVLERSQLASTVRDLPNGLLFKVREGGVNLSHGQRQLICLARVLIKQPKIVVLDEATSSVDPATDALIQATIRKEFANSTILTIAHRIETIADYDRTIQIEGGRVRRITSLSALSSQQDDCLS